MEIKKISQEEALSIIEDRKPEGLFYQEHKDAYVGIDNLHGNANVEEFKTKEECFKWLRNEPDPIDEKEVYKAALTKWGPQLQITMVFEEMSELQKELCKCLRGKEVKGNIAEEIADVEIMLGQMKELFDIEAAVKLRKEFKLERLSNRLGDFEVRTCRECGCTEYRACKNGCYWIEEDLCSNCITKK